MHAAYAVERVGAVVVGDIHGLERVKRPKVPVHVHRVRKEGYRGAMRGRAPCLEACHARHAAGIRGAHGIHTESSHSGCHDRCFQICFEAVVQLVQCQLSTSPSATGGVLACLPMLLLSRPTHVRRERQHRESTKTYLTAPRKLDEGCVGRY